MVNQVRIAILAIVVVIPLLSFGLWNMDSSAIIDESTSNSKIIAITSFFPLYDFTKQVGGENVDVSLLVPQGVEPHDWEPSIKDVQRIQNADVVIINGIGFENWVDKIDTINSDVVLIDTSIGIEIITGYEDIHEDHTDEHEEDHTDEHEDEIDEHTLEGDPHIWLNPVLAKIQVQNIADGLTRQDPSNENYYQRNADNYKSQLDNLDSKIRNDLSSCSKEFLAFHQAFSYFADEYDLIQYSITQSTDPHGEPTAKKMQNLINLAQSLNIKVVFTEEAVDSRTSQIIANEFGAQTLVLSTLEVVEKGSSYIEKMEENLQNLKVALC
ncbi:MAG: zinc ABC transporter substrate-binding protein [Nitrosopumilaceae archaeon]|nr:zinc ABC transporter substrate-binding protein [Nitrosopumilaceae archaeon]